MRGMRLVDSHCHVNADRFEGDADLVIGGARLAGVERILVPGWNVASCERALALVDRFPWLDAAVGVHPHEAATIAEAELMSGAPLKLRPTLSNARWRRVTWTSGAASPPTDDQVAW